MIRKSLCLAAFFLATCLSFASLAGEPSPDAGGSANIEGLDPEAIVAEVVEDQQRALGIEMRQGWRRFAPIRLVDDGAGVRLAQDGDRVTGDGS